MNNCFIISFYLPSQKSVNILGDIINRLHIEFDNPSIFIGFNPSPFLDMGVNLIRSMNINNKIEFGVVPKYLICDSDASGFQFALKLLKNSGKKFNLYWFLHSKSTTTNRDHEREYMINDFIYNKSKIIDLFEKNDFIGSYGDMIIQLGTLTEGHTFTSPTTSGNYLDKFFNFKIKKPLEYFYAKTFFVVRGEILNNFIYNCDESFFNSYLNIYGLNETDRYFFERDFIRIVDKTGYVLLGRVVSNEISDGRWGNISTEESNLRYLDEISMWIEKNNLSLNKENVLNILKEWQRL